MVRKCLDFPDHRSKKWYIPSVGFIIALIPPVLMAYTQYDLTTALILMENFEGTPPLAILMRYTGEEKNEERQEAAKH